MYWFLIARILVKIYLQPQLFVSRFLTKCCFCVPRFNPCQSRGGAEKPAKPTTLFSRPLNIPSERKNSPVFKAVRNEPFVPRVFMFQGLPFLFSQPAKMCESTFNSRPGTRRVRLTKHFRRKNNIWTKNPKWWNHERDWVVSAGSRQGKHQNTSAGLLWFSRSDESEFSRFFAGWGYVSHRATAG